MRRYRRSPVSLIIALFALGQLAGPALAQPAPPSPAAPEATSAFTTGQVRITEVAGGLSSPVGVVNAGDGTNRLFIVEQRGTVRVFQNNALKSGFFLDIRGVAGGFTNGGERGLLGIAFHPNFESNHKLFAYYTENGGDLVITELTANSGRTAVERLDGRPADHDRAQLASEPQRRAAALRAGRLPVHLHRRRRRRRRPRRERAGHERDARQGPARRAEPERGLHDPVRQPVRRIDARQRRRLGLRDAQSVASLLRSRERHALDRRRRPGQLYEEINREPATSSGGRNYGWDCREGLHPYADPTPGSPARLVGSPGRLRSTPTPAATARSPVASCTAAASSRT